MSYKSHRPQPLSDSAIIPFPKLLDSHADTPRHTTSHSQSAQQRDPAGVSTSSASNNPTHTDNSYSPESSAPPKKNSEYTPRLTVHPPLGHTQRPPRHPLVRIVRQLLPSIFTVFLSSVFIVVPQIANLSGTKSYAFLILVIYTLYFHCNAFTVGRHIQVTGRWNSQVFFRTSATSLSQRAVLSDCTALQSLQPSESRVL